MIVMKIKSLNSLEDCVTRRKHYVSVYYNSDNNNGTTIIINKVEYVCTYECLDVPSIVI